MGWARRALGAQRQLLFAGVFAVALSLLAMHQLSMNHHAADPTGTGMHASASFGHIDRHDVAAVDGDHTHLGPLVVDGHPWHDKGGCPGCSEHAMALTCLAALTLLAVGWLLRRPTEWRGLRLAQVVPRLRPSRGWMRQPLTLVELSVSRT